jgi:hypothetical protein
MQLFNEPLSGNVELSGGSVQEIIDLIKRCGDRLHVPRATTSERRDLRGHRAARDPPPPAGH